MGRCVRTATATAAGARQLAAALRQGRAPDWATGLTNGLAATAARLCPAIGAVRQRLHDAGAGHVQVSGSGPTVFALCASETAARRIAAAVGSGREYTVWAVPFHLEDLGAVGYRRHPPAPSLRCRDEECAGRCAGGTALARDGMIVGGGTWAGNAHPAAGSASRM